MKRFAVSLFIAASLVIYVASGSVLLQPEHQAYVLFLGLESTPEGNVHISALCPKISGKNQSEYQLFEGEGPSVSLAFRSLEEQIPRHVVYVQLKSLLLTPEFAGSDRMPELIYYLLLGAEYYSDAWVMVCEEPPSAFLADYKPAIGTRLSASIQATMANAANLNMIPEVHLADLLDGWHGIFSDVPAIACTIGQFGDTPSLLPDGAWLFAGQKLSLRLNAEETALLNWLRGDIGEIQLSDADGILHITPELPPKVSFDMDQGEIVITGHFVQHQQSDSILRSQTQYLLEEKITQLIVKCRDAGSEPFRFAEYAASRFSTLDKFIQSNFDKFYQQAEIDVHVIIRDELT